MGMIRGRLVITLLAVAHLMVAVPTSAQLVDDPSTAPYWLVVEVVVEEDGTSEGTATFGATPGALDAIAAFFSTTREDACRRIAYSHAGGSKPSNLNGALWEEQSAPTSGECLYVFTYPPGTRLSVFTVTSNGRIRFFEEFTDPGPLTLFDLDLRETPWDEEVVRALIADYGLSSEGPAEVVRITYPHVPDGPETRNARLVEGNTLVWLYSPIGTEVVPDMRGSAGPNSTTSTTARTTTIVPVSTTSTTTSTTTTVPVSTTSITTSTTAPVAEPPPPESAPFPWLLLLLVAAGAFVAGWIGGERLSGRRDENDE